MAVFRINKTNNYTVMSNYHLRDKNLSLKAKGLLSVMLSLPDEWIYSLSGIVSICKESESAVKTAMNELKQYGYLIIVKLKPNETETGRIEYIYNIYEQPQKKQQVENQGVENQPLEIQQVENQGLLNTNNKNTKVLNTDSVNKDYKKERKTSYDEILEIIEDEDLKQTYYEFIKMRKLIKSPMTDRALRLLIDKVNRMEKDTQRQIRLLENSIENGWKTVYPLKENVSHETRTAGDYFLDVAKGIL